MEALRTCNDNLQWEVHRLDAENRKLWSENPEASNRLDLETELEQTKLDAAGLTEQVQAYQRQLEELRERADADSEADGRSTELEMAREELRAANETAVTEQQKAAELELAMATRVAELDELEAARRRNWKPRRATPSGRLWNSRETLSGSWSSSDVTRNLSGTGP